VPPNPADGVVVVVVVVVTDEGPPNCSIKDMTVYLLNLNNQELLFHQNTWNDAGCPPKPPNRPDPDEAGAPI
jgi:hypothetical protein